MELSELIAGPSKEVEAALRKKYGQVKPAVSLNTIPGIGLFSALTLYAEIFDVKQFTNPEKLAHYAELVPKVGNVVSICVLGGRLRVVTSS
jgi:transposase